MDRALGARGITAFLVDAKSPGISVGKHEKKLGIRGSETVEISGARVSARRLEVHDPGGTTRHVWLDSQGRVLKVTIDGVTATRDELPR